MELLREWIMFLVLGNLRIVTVSGQVQLIPSRKATESLPLTLRCETQQTFDVTVLFLKSRDHVVELITCTRSGPCVPRHSGYVMSREMRSVTLTISAVNKTRDSGRWYCLARTSPNPTDSNEVNIMEIATILNFDALNFNPSLTSFTSVRPDQTISVTITTPCTNPAPVFTWGYRQGSSASFTDLSSAYSRTSEAASGCPSDQKKYINTLTLPGNTVSFYNKEITLRVEVEHDSFNPIDNYIKYKDSGLIQFPVPVSSVNINTTNTVNGYEGDPVLFTCTTSASFPAATVTWFKGGTEITGERSSQSGSGVVVTTTSSVRVPVRRTDQGQKIYCQAANGATGTPVKSNEVQLNVFYPPNTPVITVPNEVCAGSPISLRCLSSDAGNPQANYQWNRNGNNVNAGIHSGGSVWTFTPSKDDNEAKIRCSAGNTYTERPGSSGVQSDVTLLKIYYAADITDFSSVTIDEGQTLRLLCKADGRPSQYEFKPFVQYWGDKQVGVHRGEQSGAVYTWTVTDTSYLNTGEYECNVNNGILDGNNILDQRKRVQVLVRGKPVATSDSSQQVSGKVGSTVHLFQTFYASGLDIKSYNWTFGNTRVLGAASADPTKVTLEINGVTDKFDGFNVSIFLTVFKQEGLYTVTVCSVLGCGSSYVNLISEGPPPTPLNLTLIFTTSSSVVLRWIPNYSRGVNLVQTFILQHRAQGSAEWKNTTIDSDQDYGGYVYAQVTGLQPKTEYEFRVMGKNNRIQNNEGKFTSTLSGKTSEEDRPTIAGEYQPTTSSPLVLGLGIVLGFALLVIIALTVVVIKMYRDKSAGNVKENNDNAGRQRTENPPASTPPEYESLDDVTPRAYSQLHVDQGSAVDEHAGYLTLVQDPPVSYETVALHEYENTKSKSKDSPYMNTG